MLLAFYIGGLVASLPVGMAIRAKNPNALWPLLVHSLLWPVFVFGAVVGIVKISGSAEVSK